MSKKTGIHYNVQLWNKQDILFFLQSNSMQKEQGNNKYRYNYLKVTKKTGTCIHFTFQLENKLD